MKIVNLLTVFTFLVITSYSFGQKTKPIKRIYIDDIYINVGSVFGINSSGNLGDLKALAPKSKLLSNKSPGFSQPNGIFVNGGNSMSVMLGFKFSDKQKTAYRANPLLRIGFTYSSSSLLSSYSSRESRSPYDTLTSSQTGEESYIDSINTETIGANYSSDQLRLNASLIFRTNPKARWSLYSGIGITAGVSINASTNVYYNTFTRIEEVNLNGNSSDYSNLNSNETVNENHRNKSNFGFSAYVPLGVDFRIGNKREFWKRTHLFYEMRPEINITSIPELYTVTSARLQQGIGIRVTFD